MENWRDSLDRWTNAGLLDPATAGRIREYESLQAGSQRLHWPVLLALVFGAMAAGAGILLFVAGHWDRLSPAQRFALVLLLVAMFHVIAALQSSGRFRQTFHALGTLAVGAGIFLSGQIFHLSAEWSGAILLWALGAWIGWYLLCDQPQAALAAVLTPAWMAMQYYDWYPRSPETGRVIAAGLLMIAIAYFTAPMPGNVGGIRKPLLWIGGLALLPSALFAAGLSNSRPSDWPALFSGLALSASIAATLAWLLRGRAAWISAAAAFWVIVLVLLPRSGWNHALVYLWCAIGSAGLVVWGLTENRKERVNFGVAGFALTVLSFYVSNVLDKMQRSASLMGLGVLLLGGGYLLERARKRLVSSL